MATPQHVVIVVQQETLRERPRIYKFCRILQSLRLPFEVWKFGPAGEKEALPGIPVRNIMDVAWRRSPALLRYLRWMVSVTYCAFKTRASRFIAVGFDSALPLATMTFTKRVFLFDNIDNISLSYRSPPLVRAVLRRLEALVADRAAIHIVPSKARWPQSDPNLRIVRNTPSRSVVAEARSLAERRGYTRGSLLTVYLNGWLSNTRGIGTLLNSLALLRTRAVRVKVLVAGRPACEDATRLLALDCVEYLGMLTNAEALAEYFRTDLAFTYYDPAVAINRVAESQKWTDCWATGTAFVANDEIATIADYVVRQACITLPYNDVHGLASLLQQVIDDRNILQRTRHNLAAMQFNFWDDEMALLLQRWLAPHS